MIKYAITNYIIKFAINTDVIKYEITNYIIKFAIKKDVIIYVITNDVIKYAITNDVIIHAITNYVINKKINNNFVFPNTPAQLTLDVRCLFIPSLASWANDSFSCLDIISYCVFRNNIVRLKMVSSGSKLNTDSFAWLNYVD